MRRKGLPKPACATCGATVKRHDNRYCSQACVPFALKADTCRKWRRVSAYRHRAMRLKKYLDQVSGRTVTRELLCDLFWEFGQERYTAGFHVGRAARERGEDWRRALAEAQARGAA